MAKQPPKTLKREPTSPPPGATSESVVQPTATTPLFPEPPLSPQSRQGTGMIRMDLLEFYSVMGSLAITDRNFLGPLYSQLIEADGFGGDGLEFAVAVIKSVNPRDSLEAMLVAQMAVMHWATMKFMRQVGDVRGTRFQELAVRTATKLARVFGAQMETLKRYRSGGEQKVTVRHELVSEEGQAIVRTVTHTKSRRPALQNPVEETPALSDARQSEMPMPDDLAHLMHADA
jgi:hypothetical protein